METATNPASGAYVYPPGTAELRWTGETCTFFLASGEQTKEAFSLIDERARRGEVVPLHQHDDIESWYVIEGEIAFYIDGKPGVLAPAGSFVHVPGGVVHGFRIESESARYLILTTPRHGRFYRAISLPSRPGGLPPLESIEWAKIQQACGDFGVDLKGPLPDAS